jgi:hypothetical protein
LRGDELGFDMRRAGGRRERHHARGEGRDRERPKNVAHVWAHES